MQLNLQIITTMIKSREANHPFLATPPAPWGHPHQVPPMGQVLAFAIFARNMFLIGQITNMSIARYNFLV